MEHNARSNGRAIYYTCRAVAAGDIIYTPAVAVVLTIIATPRLRCTGARVWLAKLPAKYGVKRRRGHRGRHPRCPWARGDACVQSDGYDVFSSFFEVPRFFIAFGIFVNFSSDNVDTLLDRHKRIGLTNRVRPAVGFVEETGGREPKRSEKSFLSRAV